MCYVKADKTIDETTINGKTVPVRSVHVKDVGDVLVASETTETLLKVNDGGEYLPEDDMFYCYVPDHEFDTLTDEGLQAWVEKNID